MENTVRDIKDRNNQLNKKVEERRKTFKGVRGKMIMESSRSKSKICIIGDAKENQNNSTEKLFKYTIQNFPESPDLRAPHVPVDMVNSKTHLVKLLEYKDRIFGQPGKKIKLFTKENVTKWSQFLYRNIQYRKCSNTER